MVKRNSNQESPSLWRVFCAIELPVDLRERLRSHIATLRTKLPEANASWTRPENTHLTLKFFGNVEQSRIDQISAAADRAVTAVRPFNIVIGGSGVFPGVSRARVLWIGVVEQGGQLCQLQSRFENECAMGGFEKEARAFRPHLTIARTRKPESSRSLAEAHLKTNFEDVVVEVNKLVVLRSELSSAGSKYTALSKHPLIKR